jgi:sulfur carrier protein ThiS
MPQWRVFADDSALTVKAAQTHAASDGEILKVLEPIRIATGESDTGTVAGLDWVQVRNRLEQFRHLENDWDGQGSPPPDEDVIGGAIRLADSLAALDYPAPQAVVVGVNGTIYLEWNTADVYQEIEVTSGCAAECRRVDKRTRTVSSCQLRWC